MAFRVPEIKRSRQHLQSVFLHHSQQLQGHAAGLLVTCFPFLNGRLTGVEVQGEDRLTHVFTFTQLFDLIGCQHGGRDQAGSVKLPHGGLVDPADFEQGFGRCMGRLQGIAFEFGFRRHDKFR